MVSRPINETDVAPFLTFLQSGTGAVTRTLQDKAREVISVKDFGAVGDGVADDTAEIAAAWAACLARSVMPELVFPEGTYKAGVFPNFAEDYAKVTSRGRVILRYAGTGEALVIDSGGIATGPDYGISDMFFGRFTVECASGTTGVRVNGVHHSYIDIDVISAGSGQPCVKTEFCVCNEFRVHVTGPTGGPTYGLVVGSNSADYPTCWCTFYNTIIEGITAGTGIGIAFENAMGCLFLSGTSELNDIGVVFDTMSFNNRIVGMDFEANSTRDIAINGVSNSVIDCDTGISSGAPGLIVNGTFCEVRGGTHRTVENNGTRTQLNGFTFNRSNDGSTLTDNQSSTSIRNNLINGGASTAVDAFVTWTAYTPTVTAGSGTLTSASATGNYLTVGKTTFVRAAVVITTNGTGAGYIEISLPKAAAAASVLSGRTNANIGILANIASSVADIVKSSDGTYPGGSGVTLHLNGSYESV